MQTLRLWRSPLIRLADAIRSGWTMVKVSIEAFYLRRRISGCEFDLLCMEEEERLLPLRREAAKISLGEFRVRLIDCESKR